MATFRVVLLHALHLLIFGLTLLLDSLSRSGITNNDTRLGEEENQSKQDAAQKSEH